MRGGGVQPRRHAECNLVAFGDSTIGAGAAALSGHQPLRQAKYRRASLLDVCEISGWFADLSDLLVDMLRQNLRNQIRRKPKVCCDKRANS